MRRMMIAMLTLSACFPACAPASGTGERPGPADVALDQIVTGNARFALDLYDRLKGDGNLFFSPYSVSTALAMTYAGARGETEREMAEVLHFPVAGPPAEAGRVPDALAAAVREEVASAFGALEEGLAADPETRGYELHVANSLWGHVDYPFVDSYIEFVGEHFDAPLTLVDFLRDAEGARLKINAWVEERTRERIKNLIPSGTLTPATVLVLTNAIYFKGDWETQFDPERTREAEFRGLGGATTVRMMSRKGDYGYSEDEDVQILELPYKGDDLSMVVLLPKVEGPAGLDALERALTVESLDAWIGELRERSVAVSIPRFEMTWGTRELKGALQALAMRLAFDAGSADFSGMSAGERLFIGHVLHKAFIEVNEEGTEAAAATAVAMLRASLPLTFRADRPFVFMIRDRNTGSILFLGRITDLGE